MAYTNKVAVAVGATVLFLAVVINPQWTEAQTFPKLDRICKLMIPDILEKCFTHERLKPTKECCEDLNNATLSHVDCLCDNYIANPSFSEIAKAFSAGVLNNCGVSNKFSCHGAKNKAGNSDTTTTVNSDSNVGVMNKVAASMSVFGFVAILFLLIH